MNRMPPLESLDSCRWSQTSHFDNRTRIQNDGGRVPPPTTFVGQIQHKGPSKIPLKMSPYSQGAESLRARSLRTFPRQNGLPVFKFSRRTSTVFHMSPPWNRSTLWGFPLTILYLRRVFRAYRSWSFVYSWFIPWVCLKKVSRSSESVGFHFGFPKIQPWKRKLCRILRLKHPWSIWGQSIPSTGQAAHPFARTRTAKTVRYGEPSFGYMTLLQCVAKSIWIAS